MDNVLLDDLVFQSCVSHLDIINRIVLEPVSHNSAHILRSANAACNISLTVRVDEFESPEGIGPQMRISIASGSKCADWKVIIPTAKLPVFVSSIHQKAEAIETQRPVSLLEQFGQIILQTIRRSSTINSACISESNNDQITKTVDSIRRILLEVFSRFNHFNRLTFLPSSTWTRFAIDLMLEILSLEGFQPSPVKQLVYKPGGYSDPLSNPFKFSQRDCYLIEMFAPFLEEVMVLGGELPQQGTDLSKQFWKAIAMCTGLKKLYLCRSCDHPNLFLNKDLRDCLKSLKISEFHAYGNDERDLNSEWLSEAFRNNAKLRKLYINPSFTNIIGQLAMPEVLVIIARLKSVELAVWSYDFDGQFNEMLTNVCKIFRALPKNGYVNVEDIICVDDATLGADDIATVKALAFWIRMSDETRKPIRIYARLKRHHAANTVAVSREAIDGLQKEEEFASIKIEHSVNRTILQYNSARITLCYKLLGWKKYLGPEYLCSKGHHID